jgi:uncharacterized protein
LIDAANSIYLPYTVQMLHPVREGKPADCRNLSSLRDKMPVDGRPTAFLCQNGSCLKPAQDPDDLLDALRSNISSRQG